MVFELFSRALQVDDGVRESVHLVGVRSLLLWAVWVLLDHFQHLLCSEPCSRIWPEKSQNDRSRQGTVPPKLRRHLPGEGTISCITEHHPGRFGSDPSGTAAVEDAPQCPHVDSGSVLLLPALGSYVVKGTRTGSHV